MNEKTKAFATLAVALSALALVFLIAFGVIDADALAKAVTAVLAIGTTLVAWWRNNNVTEAAQEGQRLIDEIKQNQKEE